MTRIIVTRSSEWNNRMRDIGIYLDGKKIGAISNGETKSFDLDPGTHRLKASIDWCHSQEVPFIVGEDEKKYFRLTGFKYAGILMPATLALLVLHIIVRRTTGFNYLIWFVIPTFLVLMYYITFGRNNYLRLKETESWETV